MIHWLKKLLNTSAHFDTATMVYTLTNAFGSKIFNFNEFVNNLDVKAFLDDNFTFLCEIEALHS